MQTLSTRNLRRPLNKDYVEWSGRKRKGQLYLEEELWNFLDKLVEESEEVSNRSELFRRILGDYKKNNESTSETEIILQVLDELSLHHEEEEVREAAEIIYPVVRDEVEENG